MNTSLVYQWQKGVRIKHISHNRAASSFKTKYQRLGVVATVLSTLAASSIFASFADSEKIIWLITAGIISILTAVVNAINTFLSYGELAEKHRQAANGYGELRRYFETETLDAENLKVDELKDLLEVFSQKLSELEKSVPEIPQKLYNKVKKGLDKKKPKAS